MNRSYTDMEFYNPSYGEYEEYHGPVYVEQEEEDS